MRRYKAHISERIVVFICVFFISLFSTSFRWPAEGAVKLTSTFGESRGDHFHEGIDLVSYSKSVYPIDDALLLYTWNKALFPFDDYTGSGNYMVLDHGEVASIYLHLADSSYIQQRYTKDQAIGLFANTGRSYGAHIHFSVHERTSWDSINFLQKMEKLEDTVAPEIDHMAFYIGDTYMRLTEGASIRLTKHYPLLFSIFDSINKGDRHGVYTYQVFANGMKVQDVTFDEIELKENSLQIKGKALHSIFEGKSYYKAENIRYKEGLNTFKVIASDYAGNTSEKDFTLNIRLDM